MRLNKIDSQTQIFLAHSRYELIVHNRITDQEEELFEQYLFRINEFDEKLANAGFEYITKYPALDHTQTISENIPNIIYKAPK